MNNKYFEIYSKRTNRMTAILFFISAIILTGYIRIQLFPQPELKKIVEEHAYKEKTIIGNRGKITDTNGKELAVTINKYTFWVNTLKKHDKKNIIDLFSKVFKKDSVFYQKKLSKRSKYISLEKNISDVKANQILNKMKGIDGLRFDKNPSRLYNYNNLACQTIGYVNTNGIGSLGIERSCNHLLTGDTTHITLKKGANGKFFNTDILDENKINGSNVQLTIDIELERILQEELSNAIEITGAKGANGIIMNPYNGEILAMASVPDFNPNNYNKFDIISYNNSVISDAYEPGSTLKIIPYAFALQSNKFTLTDSIFCENGSYKLANNRMLNDHEEHGFLSVEEILIHSSNIGISKISNSFNKKSLYKFLKKFGLGSKTYLPLNNESGGKIRSISEWSRTSKNYISIGQEIALTNLQLALAYCTIANGGYMIKPKIIKKIVKNGDINYINKTTEIRKVLDKEIASNILKTLKLVVNDGTAKSINLIGYNIAGKTGTAQKFENGAYSKFIATFASIFPTDNPEFVMIVSIDEPAHGKHWANLSAVPASREIIKRMIILNKDFHNKTSDKLYINTTIDSTYKFINNQTITFGEIPDFRGMSLRESFRVAEIIGLKLNPRGVSGTVLSQSIPPGTRLKPNMICKITMKI